MFITTTCGTTTRFKDDDEIKQASESYLESMQQEFYLTGSKSCLINVTYALVLRVIMLNNNIKILLVSFVHHIELQNFLNAPRICRKNVKYDRFVAISLSSVFLLAINTPKLVFRRGSAPDPSGKAYDAPSDP